MKPRSFEVTDGSLTAPARAMLRAVGMNDADWDEPQIGVASSWNEVTPCNLPLDRLAKQAKEGVRAAGGFPFEFVTIAVSDGISMAPEAVDGGPIGLVADGDRIVIDVVDHRIDLMVNDEELERRRSVLVAPTPRSTSGVLAKCARLVTEAEFGAVTRA